MTKLAIAGATGLVGRNMLDTIDRKGIQFDELVLFSSARSAGTEVSFQGKTYTVRELTEEAANEQYDFVLMSAGGSTSEHFSLFSNKLVPWSSIIQVNGVWSKALT